jgi:hypothetical protein
MVVVAGESTCPQSCSLATAAVLSPVYTAAGVVVFVVIVVLAVLLLN